MKLGIPDKRPDRVLPTAPSALRIKNRNATLCSMAHDHPTTLPPDPVIERYKRDVDRTLLRENLKLSVEQRFRQLQKLQQFASALKRAPRSSKNDRL